MVDYVQAKEGYRHLVSRSVSLVERVPGFAAGRTVCLKLLSIASESLPFGTMHPFGVGRRRRPEAPFAVSPANSCP